MEDVACEWMLEREVLDLASSKSLEDEWMLHGPNLRTNRTNRTYRILRASVACRSLVVGGATTRSLTVHTHSGTDSPDTTKESKETKGHGAFRTRQCLPATKPLP